MGKQTLDKVLFIGRSMMWLQEQGVPEYAVTVISWGMLETLIGLECPDRIVNKFMRQEEKHT